MNQEASSLPQVILLGGATASGKSQWAMALADHIPVTIINADSMQMYRELPILTATPGLNDKKRVPHCLYGAWDKNDMGSVAAWLQLCCHTIDSVLANQRIPLIVGGTGLYFKALLEGLHPIPDIPEDIRGHALQLQQTLGQAVFYQRLLLLDPKVLQLIKPHDRYRSLRAWEVVTATGKSMFDFRNHDKNSPLNYGSYRWCSLLVLPEREVLYQRCDQRWLTMIERGVVEEVEAFLQYAVHPSHPLNHAVGVKEIQSYLEGRTDQQTMIEHVQRRTRQYAKRQITWFRHQRPWCDPSTLRILAKADHASAGLYIHQTLIPHLRITH